MPITGLSLDGVTPADGLPRQDGPDGTVGYAFDANSTETIRIDVYAVPEGGTDADRRLVGSFAATPIIGLNTGSIDIETESLDDGIDYRFYL